MYFTTICVFVLPGIISAQDILFPGAELSARNPVISSSPVASSTVRKTSAGVVATTLPNRTVCGLENTDKKIFSGEETLMKELPWMAALEYRSKLTGLNEGVKCGGSILNNRYVLTAAHCIINANFELIKVRLGEWRISTDPDCHTINSKSECADPVVKFSIEEQFVHPDYSFLSNTNDIGLLLLEKDIKYTDYIRPICLPDLDQADPQIQTRMIVAGWGLTENGTTSDVKLKVDIPLVPIDICRTKLRSRSITTNQLCVGGEKGRDSCKGDSGGPLIRLFDDSIEPQWYQEGVVSWGLGCGREGFPAIYTRVSEYRDWIDNIISAGSPPSASIKLQSKTQDDLTAKIHFPTD